MISRKYIKNNKNIKSSPIWIKLALFILVPVLLIRIFVVPIIIKSMEYQGKMIVTNVLSKTISDILEDKDISYDNIVKIQKDGNNKITSIQTDIKAVNLIKSKLSANAANMLNSISSYEYSLPIGTLLGNSLFIGRGPSIKLSVSPFGYLNSQITSSFEEAGINQTSYKIMLNIVMDYTTVIPLYKSTSRLDTNFVLVDTIIVGDIPEYYTNIKGQSLTPISDSRMVYPQKISN